VVQINQGPSVSAESYRYLIEKTHKLFWYGPCSKVYESLFGSDVAAQEAEAMSSRFSPKPVVPAVPVAVVANEPGLADTRIEAPVALAPGRQITTKGEAVRSSDAAKMLRHIAAAGTEPQRNGSDAQEAKREPEQGDKPKVQTRLPALIGHLLDTWSAYPAVSFPPDSADNRGAESAEVLISRDGRGWLGPRSPEPRP
jgi:hypothetical protein